MERGETNHGTGLRANTLGLLGLATLGAVMMSPALGLYGLWGPMAAIIGKPVPLVYLGALAISIPTAISYALVSRELPSAGSAFTWIWRTASPAIGTFVGLMMSLYYVVAVILQPIIFGLFFNDLLNFLGIDGTGLGTWAIGALLLTAFGAFLTYFGIEISVRSAVMFIVVEMAVVVALSSTIVVSKLIHGGFTLDPFTLRRRKAASRRSGRR